MSNDDRLLELAEKATRRPWHYHEGDIVTEDHKDDVLWAESELPDSQYIIASANCLPDLVRRIQALRVVCIKVRDHEVGASGDWDSIYNILSRALEADDTLAAQMKVEP